jgi:hypothetical protein
VDGPEARDLISRLNGYIVTNDNGEIRAISLPNLKTHTVVRPKVTRADAPTIHALSGPDRAGRIAYIEDHFFVQNVNQRRHSLKTVRIDGSGETQLFSRPGDAMWALTPAGNGEIGSQLALAPVGGNVAILSALRQKQMPGALLHVGQIEIWNIDNKVGEKTSVNTIDNHISCTISWFPDGQRLAYTTLVAKNDLPKSANGLVHFRNYFGKSWQEVPAVYIYDVNTHHSSFFSVGWRGVVSHDGQTIFIGGWDNEAYRWLRADASSGRLTPLEIPGYGQDLLGTAPGDLILYVGLPTTGAPQKLTKNNSPIRGPKPLLTVKVADDQGRFQTIVPYIDPRSKSSFGVTN